MTSRKILKYIQTKGEATTYQVCRFVKLPIDPVLEELRYLQSRGELSSRIVGSDGVKPAHVIWSAED